MNQLQLNGLTHDEVLESRARYGENILTPPPSTPLWIQFLEKFQDPLIRILLVAFLLSIGIASYEYFCIEPDASVFLEPLGIFIAVILATGVGFIVEVNANKKFKILNQVNDEIMVKVIRDGKITETPRKDIVVGDIVILETGDEVPADGELLDSMMLSINESTLTGEPMTRKTHDSNEANKKSTDTTYPANHAMKGTSVIEGHGVMRVFAVGDRTEYGKVYTEAQIENTSKTPLFEQFDRLGKVISYMSYTVALLILLGRFAMYDYSAEFVTTHFLNYAIFTVMLAVTLIVVSVPEGLPMSVNLSLALSMRRMLNSNNLVRKMHACETMGATNIICTDKTGTLTQNQMSVHQVHFFGSENAISKTVAEGIACNTTAFIDDTNPDRIKTLGNPTEGALILWLRNNGIDYLPIRENTAVVEQLPFSTERKYMATIVNSNALGKKVLYLKGAPEILLNMCESIEGNVDKEHIIKLLAEYQAKAMRTLAFAYQELADDDNAIENNKVVANHLTLLGIVAIADPVRADVPDAINECLNAGIEVKIITGDIAGTATEIGRQVGL